MWRTSDDHVHTISLPDPSEIFTEPALAAVRRLLDRSAHDDVARLVERLELAAVDYWDAHPTIGEVEAPFVEETPPLGLVDRVVGTLEELEAALTDVNPRWRLDVAMALDDLSDMA